ncbi:MAG TPA: hypothetical protein VFY06_01475, partial [Verrucomicrobiae bacterium]|nr:hypothetical protein [Verrucomicrobiae bacterium]
VGWGTVFRFSTGIVPIVLHAQRQGTNLVLIWSDPSFSLQFAPAITGIFSNVPDATSPFTNSIVGSQAFFRLIGN